MDGRPVLVVDDDSVMREAIAEMLALAGYPVETAIDGLDALHHIERSHPSLVVTDAHMPNLNAEGLGQALRERGLDPPILVVTGTTREARAVIDAVGADECLLKPLDIEVLLATVERLRIP